MGAESHGMRPIHEWLFNKTPRRSKTVESSGRKRRSPRKTHPVRTRHLRCDCGRIAVTVITVRVGIDPQYTIHLPLCRECLSLEQGFRAGN